MCAKSAMATMEKVERSEICEEMVTSLGRWVVLSCNPHTSSVHGGFLLLCGLWP